MCNNVIPCYLTLFPRHFSSFLFILRILRFYNMCSVWIFSLILLALQWTRLLWRCRSFRGFGIISLYGRLSLPHVPIFLFHLNLFTVSFSFQEIFILQWFILRILSDVQSGAQKNLMNNTHHQLKKIITKRVEVHCEQFLN